MQVAHGVGKYKTVAGTYCLNNTGSNIIFVATGVCLIHGMEFATTARDLTTGLRLIFLHLKCTYVFIVGIFCDVVGVRGIFDKIGPPRSKLWVLNLAVL